MGGIIVKRIVLLSCTSKKKNYPCLAAEMYSESPNFSRAYEYAKLVGDQIYILSPKYGLLSEDQLIEPYEMSLKRENIQFNKNWSQQIFDKLKQSTDIENDHFTIITGENYYRYYLSNLKHYDIPLKGKRIGEWIPTLSKLIAENPNTDPEVMNNISNSVQASRIIEPHKISTKDIRAYIQKLLMDAFQSAEPYIDLLSKDIHKQLGLKNRYPMVCSAMYHFKTGSDAVLTAPPKGNGATVKIRYFSNNH